MSPPGEAEGPPRRRDEARLSALHHEIGRRRAALLEQRALPDSSVQRARVAHGASALARAMERYADQASGAGIPLPYRYRDQVRLYDALAASLGWRDAPH